jgi:hypothetical protein
VLAEQDKKEDNKNRIGIIRKLVETFLGTQREVPDNQDLE